FLLGRVTTYASDRLAEITTQRGSDPLAASSSLARMLALLKGDELGKPFDALFKELKDDKKFQAEVKAAGLLADIIAQAGKIGLGSSGDGAKPGKAAVNDVAENLKGLQKRYPGTLAAD